MSVGPVVRDDATAEFFDAAAEGRFLLRQCAAGHYSEPPAVQCTGCGTAGLRWVAASGAASLVSWAVSWTRPAGGSEPSATVLVIGELDEGPWWWTRLAGDQQPDPAELVPGRRLRIDFERAAGDYEAVPVFRLA